MSFFESSQRLVTDSCCSIAIVHGLQGHPFKTWACKVRHRDLPSTTGSSIEASEEGHSSRKSYHHVVPLFSRKSSDSSSAQHRLNPKSPGKKDAKEGHLFWPQDLLPIQCPNARILVYGYDTRVTNYLSRSTNENSVHSHGKDLLSSLAASRQLQRPLILIAHSLGGIIVKQMLASSSYSTEDRLKDVVASTAAVIFLGTPHRGSPDLATLGDRARNIISALRMRTNPAILDALRLKTRDLELVQESFSAVWGRYNFRVKTFQEGLTLTGLNLGALGRKVVPDYSSLLGDARERAETIQANHRDMCRFTGPDDPNYGRICGEITSIYDSIARLDGIAAHQRDIHSIITETLTSPSHEGKAEEMDEHEMACLQSLSFPNMNQRIQNLDNPAKGTCSWFFKHESFVDWLAHTNQTQFCGLLCLRGKPGSGKSTLLKEAFFRTATETSGSERHVAAFFFNAKGDDLEHSSIGMLRSILHQICSQSPNLRRILLGSPQGRRALYGEDTATWDEAELKDFFRRSTMIGQKARLLIFIDAIDECDSRSMRDVVDFWRETTKSAHNAGCQFSVCLSSRHSPAITVNDCPEIIMEDHNYPDIVDFVGRRLDLGMSGTHEDRQAIQRKILEKSGGMFLWVSLVVKDVLRERDEGKGLKSLLKDLDSVPRELESLFSKLLTTGEFSEKAVRVFQWALLPAKPLRLHEWHHILAFIGDTPPSSLHQWRQSGVYTEDDEQLEKRITHLSRGLLGFNIRADDATEPGDETMSDMAGAGSLDLNSGETRVIQVVHESVRQYFIEGPGFSVLSSAFGKEEALAHAHLQIMSVCLNYISITELDALIAARQRAQQWIGSPHAQGDNRKYHDEQRGLSTSAMSHTRDETAIYPLEMPMNQPRAPVRLHRTSSVASFGSASSHDGRQTPVELGIHQRETWRENNFNGSRRRKRSLQNGSPSPAPHTRRRMDDDPSTYHNLKNSSGPIARYDVASWRSSDFHSNEGTSYHEPDDHDSPRTSVTGCSQVLEDYPALLSYATSQLFTHARKADAEGLDPTQVIWCLRNGTWDRWKALQEDIDGQIELLYYAADLGLSSWLKVQGIWEDCEVMSAITLAVEVGNCEVFGKLILAFPSVVYAKNNISRILGSLASAPDAALLQAYLLQHPAQNRAPTNSTMAIEDLLESKDEDGRTALHLAVAQQNKAGVLVLLKHGADVTVVDSRLRTPLHRACIDSLRPSSETSSDRPISDDILAPRADIIELLLDHHAPINAVDAKGRTPLSMACSRGDLPLPKDTDEYAAITGVQSEKKSFNVVDILLQRGADASIRDHKGSLPLHRACYTGSAGRQSKVSIVSKLLDHGSPVDVVGDGGSTPLHFACSCSDVTIVEELLRRGANPTLQDGEGCSPLHIAAAFSTGQVVDALTSLPGTSVNVTNKIGSTPLHVACALGSISHQTKPMRLRIIRRLLGVGAKAYTIRNRAGRSPFDIARDRDFEEALALLAKESCDAPSHKLPERILLRAYSFPPQSRLPPCQVFPENATASDLPTDNLLAGPSEKLSLVDLTDS